MAALEDAVEPTTTLNTFTLDDLARFTREGSFAAGDSPDFRVLYVGRDDVHGALKYLLARCSRSLRLNMFGYDDDELDQIIRHLVESEHVYVQGTLDKSQASGVHERRILAGWSDEVRNSFAIGQSATHQISHSKGGVIDGLVAWEGSTNWSASGEGTGIVLPDPAEQEARHAGLVEAGVKAGLPEEVARIHAERVYPKQPAGFKAQNNTLAVYTHPVEIAKFTAELDEEHTTAMRQNAAAHEHALA